MDTETRTTTDNAGSSAAPGSATDLASLRASMQEVAKILRGQADALARMAETIRYDEPRRGEEAP